MTGSSDEPRDQTEPIGELLDPAGGVLDDGQERNFDGESREEYLDIVEENLADGNVLMEDDFWRVEEEAIDEVGAEEVARLRARTRAFLEAARAELNREQP